MRFLPILFAIILSVESKSLKQLHIVFRHGERAPTETYKNDPHFNVTWSGGWGHLTNRGKLQMFELGTKLRKLYDLIPEYYFPEDVSVLSSYADRCLMSAEALLAGLFPPKDQQIWNKDLLWQPIAVHYVPRAQDNLIAMKAACKTYDQTLAEVLSSGEIKEINEKNKELFSYLTQYTGQKIDTIGSVELLYNTLEIEMLHNLTLPPWTQNVSFELMKTLAARSLESFTETSLMKRLKGGVFLKHVISSVAKENPSLHLYAAHDLTLVNILKTLGYRKMLKPGFGAWFVIEVYNNSEIEMKYWDDVHTGPEEINVENCSKPCDLNQFKTLLSEYLPENWEEECNNWYQK